MIKPFKSYNALTAYFVASITILCFAPPSLAAHQEKERALIKVAIDAEYQPYEYSSADGLVHGFLP